MKTVMLPLLAALCWAMPAHAKWVKYDMARFGTIYSDAATLEKRGDQRYLWLLTKVESGGKPTGFEAKSRIQVDCAAKRWRIVEYRSFEGGVSLVIDTEPGEWSAPDMVPKTLEKIVACD